MVQLVEVEDEHFQQPQVGPEEDDEDFTDTGTTPSPDPFLQLSARPTNPSLLAPRPSSAFRLC